MAKKSTGAAKAPKSKLPVILLIGALVLLGVVLFLFVGYRNRGDNPSPAAVAAQVAISEPSPGIQIDTFDPLQIKTTAAGPNPFLSMELWVNGELVAVQGAQSPGKTPLSTQFGWFPTEPGSFSLVARAVDADGQISSSPAVIVFVNATDKSIADFPPAIQDSPAFFPAPAGGYIPPQAPGPDSSVGPSDGWAGDPSDWIDSFSNDTVPAAPELLAEGDGCAAKLSIHDLSDNEEGFAIYRQLSNSPSWQLVATLASQSQNDWITYSDQGAQGGVTYYAAAFNSQGQMESNLALANIDPDDCPEASPGGPLLKVELLGLFVDGSPEMTYCYRSLNDIDWTRWPLTGFFMPGEDGSFAKGEKVEFLLSDLDQNPVLETLDLRLECWGWFGDDLQFLGSLLFDNLGPEKQGEITEIDDLLSAGILVDLTNVGDTGIYPLGGDFDFEIGIDYGIFAKFKIIDPTMVGLAAFVTHDPDECTNHLPEELQNLLGTLLLCFPYPGFGAGEQDNPQPYLVWNFLKTCNAGYGTPAPCHDYAYWLALAESEGGQVGFDVKDESNAGDVTWVVTAPGLRNLTVPPNGCTGQRTFHVQMWYQHGGETVYSPISNPWTFDCPEAIPNSVTVNVTFNSITLDGTDDNDDGAEDVEVYGYFKVDAPSALPGQPSMVKVGTWDDQDGDCPDDNGGSYSANTASCPVNMYDYSAGLLLSNYYMCQANVYATSDQFHCTIIISENSTAFTNWVQPNNTITVTVTDGDAFNFFVELWDWDDASGNDLVCFAIGSTSSKSMFEWSTVNQGFTLIGFGDPNTCVIKGFINAN